MRRGTTVRLVAFTLALGAIAFAVAFFIPWLPDQASEEREGIDFVFWLTAGICLGIFGLVAAVTLYAVVRFRRKPDDDTDGLPIHGHTGLEIVWTAIPTVLVIVIAVASGIVLVQNDRPNSDDFMQVNVTAQQFAWSFQYPEADNLTTTQLVLPNGRSTKLKLTARDVIHSFWVPEFGQKIDAVPGQETELVITPKKLGQYTVICTELCGLGHAVMRARAIVMPAAAFDKWLTDQEREQNLPPGQAGAAVFENNGCGSCHTYTPAGTQSTVGPNLDDLEARDGKEIDEYVRESLVDPNAYVAPGFNPNIMPSFAQLPADQLDALVQYLVEGNEAEDQ